LGLKNGGASSHCQECEDAKSPCSKHHQYLPDWQLLGYRLEEGIFNGKGCHGCNHPTNTSQIFLSQMIPFTLNRKCELFLLKFYDITSGDLP
jgi:hypothetical protein